MVKLLIFIVHLFFLNQYPYYTKCTEDIGNTRTEYGGQFNVRLTSDSLFIYRDRLIFDSYERDGGILYKNKEIYFLVFAEGTCRIVKPRGNYTMQLTNGTARLY